jgi:hypothetical protein
MSDTGHSLKNYTEITILKLFAHIMQNCKPLESGKDSIIKRYQLWLNMNPEEIKSGGNP